MKQDETRLDKMIAIDWRFKANVMPMKPVAKMFHGGTLAMNLASEDRARA